MLVALRVSFNLQDILWPGAGSVPRSPFSLPTHNTPFNTYSVSVTLTFPKGGYHTYSAGRIPYVQCREDTVHTVQGGYRTYSPGSRAATHCCAARVDNTAAANMSLVGSFTSNGDREASHNGVASAGAVHPAARIGSDTSDDSTIAEETRHNTHNSTLGADVKDSTFTTTQNSDADSAERRNSAVHALARRYTQQSTTSTIRQNPFNATAGSLLDPNGEHFNARAWAKAMLHTQLEDPNAPPVRTAGVAFHNLNVHGFGSDTDYQKSVGNVWLEGPGFARKLLGNKGRKIEILQSLDGLVEAGEMLVVLGPPGSGCSTFLKTIAGETHGFFVDQSSNINYQGMANTSRH